MYAVKPTALLPLPLVYMPRGASLCTYDNNCDFDVPGSIWTKNVFHFFNFFKKFFLSIVPPHNKIFISPRVLPTPWHQTNKNNYYFNSFFFLTNKTNFFRKIFIRPAEQQTQNAFLHIVHLPNRRRQRTHQQLVYVGTLRLFIWAKRRKNIIV